MTDTAAGLEPARAVATEADEPDRAAGGAPGDGDLDSAWTVRASWLFVALILVRFGALLYLLLTHQETIDGGLAGDVRRYVEMATAKGTPYRDFQVEYPPVTYALIKLLDGADLGRSIAFVALSQFLCDLGIAGVIRWGWGRRAMMAYLLLGLPLICWPFIYVRIDLFTVLITMAALALIRRSRDISGSLLLAVAILAKLWPFAVAPVLLVERKVKGVIALGMAAVAMFGVWVVVGGTSGPTQVLSFRDATGWQVESVPGIIWHLRDPSRIKFESGAFRTGVMPLWGRPLLTLMSLAFIAAAWLYAERRRRAGADDLVVYSLAPLASVLALLIFSAILSPQYIVWMLPFAALTSARGDKLTAALTFAIAAVTAVSYVFVPSAAEGHLWATLPVLLRDVLLVVLFVVSFESLADLRGSWRSRDARAPSSAIS
jgi:hypothetical protein